MVDHEGARSFVATDWTGLAADKERYWAEWKRQEGPGAGVQMAAALRAQIKRARPDWPSERERREDLETHLRVLEVVARAGRCSR